MPGKATVHNVVKDRLIISALILAALPFVKRPVAWAHVTLETSLNLLWVLLALGAFVRWVAPGDRRRPVHPPGLVSLVFVLFLLFPVISANDDLVQLDLINDAQTSQCIITSLKSDKQLSVSAGLLGSTAVPAVKVHSFLPFLPLTSGFVFEPVHAACVATPGETTGNHSPPLC